MQNSKSLLGISPDPKWYCHDVCKDNEELGNRLKEYSEENDPTKKEVLHQWKNQPKDVQECTARRRLYLMKLMVLRAHGIVADDFKGIKNTFNRIGRSDT